MHFEITEWHFGISQFWVGVVWWSCHFQLNLYSFLEWDEINEVCLQFYGISTWSIQKIINNLFQKFVKEKKYSEWRQKDNTCEKYLHVLKQRNLKLRVFSQLRILWFIDHGNKLWWECREKGTLPHCWWECKPVQPLWKGSLKN